ncbi:hypothetical protein HPB51_005390 [Rhipicephalus microplus]|uniref:Uncharacterized protein n=1 Tax=Rhipicephalus microplus TaxID=6941 RepID=A0A9J6EMQ2_RHIMP|nr:hypothetical protein HPB51_005390 [Rhipicephalus microplus]
MTFVLSPLLAHLESVDQEQIRECAYPSVSDVPEECDFYPSLRGRPEEYRPKSTLRPLPRIGWIQRKTATPSAHSHCDSEVRPSPLVVQRVLRECSLARYARCPVSPAYVHCFQHLRTTRDLRHGTSAPSREMPQLSRLRCAVTLRFGNPIPPFAVQVVEAVEDGVSVNFSLRLVNAQ